MRTIAELAWAAGIVEGEGCISHRMQDGKHYRMTLAVSMSDQDIVQRMLTLFGGTIQGPIVRKDPHHKVMWRWEVTNHRAAGIIMTLMFFFGERRFAKAKESLMLWRAYKGKKTYAKRYCCPAVASPWKRSECWSANPIGEIAR